ncbi:hypothetical protein evm_001943 [Chilo suppressalis]|nr:hypothetical protein evm_001943 [Chilo suppressalis]
MSTKILQLDSYRKSLLNRVTSSNSVTEYIENCLAREDAAAKHSFHKIMVHSWTGTAVQLFDTLSQYFTSTIVPMKYVSMGDITSFYTCSLSLIMKMIKLDFMFPFQRNMFNIDILFNDKNSVECFENPVTIEDIVCGVVSGRMNEKFELDLSNFCCDPEFIEKKITFYKINLLSHFKILMLRVGRDTRMLNLSNNELSQVPTDILNFFIRGELIAVDLSHNNIPSLSEVLRVSSRIEKLWIEGNPLCDELDAVDYVKNIVKKFPRLTELDGININQQGLMLPYFKNYLVTPDRRTKMVTEKFLTLYFSNYDCRRKRMIHFYVDKNVTVTLVANFNDADIQMMPVYGTHSRNILDPNKQIKVYKSKQQIGDLFHSLPPSTHDPSSFTVDVPHHDKKSMVLVVDGVYKERTNRVFQFRRTFVFKITTVRQNSIYSITNEIFSVAYATEEQIQNSFKGPIRNMNELSLIDPEQEDKEAIIKAFIHITQLKKHEAEARLKLQVWDIRKAIHLFMEEMKNDKISGDKFLEEDDFSDISSLMDDEVD